ncbi:hypothetical protein CKF58_00520 [Psittacicella hinzii]|uniref:Uncharacterized protein n=2 Tax=Psittacicella hinzii TaxID=2028575 RepID=A0A3A1YUB9_9GAMM|nr:hypothetical protein CKF58_00520 [Psittacicella hinzii]
MLFFTGLAHAEYYKVFITRVSNDLYRTSEGIYIQTQYCYQYVYGENAILNYSQYNAYGNQLIFQNNQTCTVKSVFR